MPRPPASFPTQRRLMRQIRADAACFRSAADEWTGPARIRLKLRRCADKCEALLREAGVWNGDTNGDPK